MNNYLNYDFEKDVTISIDSIRNLKKEKAFKTELKGFPIDNTIATSSKNNDEGFTIKFFIENPFDIKLMQDFKKFGIDENIILRNGSIPYSINKNSVTDVTVSMSSPTVVTINVKHFQNQEKSFFDDKILRLVVPTKTESNFGSFSCKSNHISGTTTFCGLIEIKINDKSYHLFKHSNDDTNENFLIIDSLESNNFSEFKKNTTSILLAFGFITGNLHQDEYYYQVIEKDNITLIKATAYFKKEASIISDVNLFNPMEFQEYVKQIKQEYVLEKIDLQLKPEIFSNMCKIVSENLTLKRTIKLVLEGNQTKLLLLRAGIYSIALETITSLISDENESKLKPITDRENSKKFIKECKEILEKQKSSISEYGYDVLKSKIENINSPTNSKKLSKPFEIFKIKLSKSELAILNHRNKFLHGTSPFEEIDLPNKDYEIAYISKKLLTLCNTLILKYCGYKGYMVDYGGYHKLNWENKLEEHLFKII